MTSSFPRRTRPAPTRIIWNRSRKAVVAAGARTVNIPDTVGFSVPEEYGAADRPDRRERSGDCAMVSVHCHDDLGLAVANSLAAVEAGARQIECTINGIGERAGNCSLEEIVMVLKTRSGSLSRIDTGIHTEHLYPASQLLSARSSRSGRSRTRRSWGATRSRTRRASTRTATSRNDHLRNHRSDDRSAFPKGKLVLGKHSGRHALKKRCEELGFELSQGGTRRRVSTLHGRWRIARKA